MKLTSDYWNSMDEGEETKKLDVSPSEIGISHGIGDVGEGLKANVFRGAKHVELGFMGVGKGSRSSPTGFNPESFSREEREDMRALARINEVELSIHATPNVVLSGFGEGGFRPEVSEQAIHEVRRAIDFAADVAGGGPVVFHIAEFPRPMHELEGGKFKSYSDEEKRAPMMMVDARTGTVQSLRRDSTITRPKPAREGADPYIEPKRNGTNNEIEMEHVSIADVEQEWKKKISNDEFKKNYPSAFSYIYKEYLAKQVQFEKGESAKELDQAKIYFHEADQWKSRADFVESLKKNDKNLAVHESIETLKKLKQAVEPGDPAYTEYIKKIMEDPTAPLREFEKSHRQRGEAYQRVGVDREVRAQEQQESIDHIVDIRDYGKEYSAKQIAKTAMYAYDMEKSKKLNKPLWVAPENWTPELYGSHPQEYKELILASRQQMADELEKRFKMKADEAKKVATEHIKGTFDVGHANFWWKYFQAQSADGDPVKARKEFEGWIHKETEKLTKDGIIGHVHLSDNFGYHDEHLAPGQGNFPTSEFVKRIKAAGFKGKMIAEPGGTKPGQEHTVWTESWKLFGSPIYRIDGRSTSWTDIGQSYFGRAPQSPYFLVGDIVPSKDWSLWSETPLE